MVYENQDLLIVNKPYGLLSQSDQAAGQDTLVERIRYYLWKKNEYDPENENSFSPAICNRLDRNTCGLVIAAKNAKALRILNAAIALFQYGNAEIAIIIVVVINAIQL